MHAPQNFFYCLQYRIEIEKVQEKTVVFRRLILYNEEKAWAQPEVARKKSRRKPRLIDKRAAV
jgi:hypothetical protein